jgi:hypothetical protein
MKGWVLLISGLLAGIVLCLTAEVFIWCKVASFEVKDVDKGWQIESISKHIKILEFRMKKGLSKGRLQQIIGSPHNNDNENVWLWACDYSKFLEGNPEKSWHKYPHGLYVIFDEHGRTVFAGFRDTESYPIGDRLRPSEFSHLIGTDVDYGKMMDDELDRLDREEAEKNVEYAYPHSSTTKR